MSDTPLVSFRLDKVTRDTFQKLYPYCLTRFIKKCILLAIKNKDFFIKIYHEGDL